MRYLVADSGGEPRLFRVSRVVSAEADEAPARRRDGVELAELWQELRRQVEERPAPLAVVARVRRDWLGGVAAVRILLSFGGDAEVLSPPEVRDDLAAVAAATAALYDRTRV